MNNNPFRFDSPMASGILPVNHCMLFFTLFFSVNTQSIRGNCNFQAHTVRVKPRNEEIDLVAEPSDFDTGRGDYINAVNQIKVINFDFFFSNPQYSLILIDK